jgi:hypothetical protein
MSYRLSVLLGTLAASTPAVQADWVKYYVSTDQRSAPLTVSGDPYPDQPNFNRLQLLYEHRSASHWHAKARLQYSGPAAAPVLGQNTGAMQESQATTGIWTRLNPSTVADYDGSFGSGFHISKPVTGDVDDNFTIRSIESLRGFGPTDIETVMLNSSPLTSPDPKAGQGRYAGGIDALSHVHIELVSVSDPALKVFINAEGSVDPLLVGNNAHVGDGNNWEFTPILALANADVSGLESVYTATFRMTDEDGVHGDSGLFSFTVAVPEPASLGLLGLGSLLLRRRR